ncbi:MAG: LL-diaminopimelate aminotransferase [Deltaproteobacteria bacterium]|nr:LL-diaminopimelate aminotransferase [Deltaproteobacteria bacterium]
MKTPVAQRIQQLGEYLFAGLDRKKQEAIQAGLDVVDLGVGDPDLPTPSHVIEALAEAARRPENHQYPSYKGKRALRLAIAEYMKRRFSVDLDPDREIVVLIGSKEGIAHLSWALIDPDDLVLVPDPAYPVYAATARFCGGHVERMPLLRSHGFLPDLDEADRVIRSNEAARAKLMWLCYPNNPTSATATSSFFERAVTLAARHEMVVANDAAYYELYLDGVQPPSILQVRNAKDVAVEFYSLSKTFNMTGWRVGWAAGNAEVIGALGRVKTNVDSGVFGAVQDAALAALTGDWSHVVALRKRYARRRDRLMAGLERGGWDAIRPTATFFVLAACPNGMTSIEAVEWLLDRAGIVATPAVAMGPHGEGFVRFSLTAGDDRIEEAARRLEAMDLTEATRSPRTVKKP